ncbi:MAG: HAD-IIB family hydrolase [Planctomycetota bacterium]
MTWAVFTDLDGTLLDAGGYSWSEAQPAIAALRARKIPLVFCTSKTWAETAWYQQQIGVHDPCVVENGGGLHDGTETVALGTPHPTILDAFREMKARCPALRGFSEMDDAEVAALTGLPVERAGLARRREFDEPFVAGTEDGRVPAEALEAAHARGLRVSRGGRFHHLHGATDKGTGVREVRRRLVARTGPIRTIGLGDSEVDASLLAEVDVPVLIPRADGRVDPALAARFPSARRAPEPGGAGWRTVVLDLVG